MMRTHGVFGRRSGCTTSLVLAALAGLGGCSDRESMTELVPDGPPKVLQVFAQERVAVTNDDGSTTFRTRMQLAYGDHPDIKPEDDNREVSNAIARDTQKLRVVLDELLDGSTLEQVSCADGSFSDIPSGTTPDDIKDCTGELTDCTKVCIGDAGPVGVLDEDEDGAADDYRFKEGAVTIECAGQPMELDLQKSFYNPSGNQQISADPDLGLNGLGPAIVLVPTGLRTGSRCTLTFGSDVLDKDGIQVCAPTPCPPTGCDVQSQPCNPGDTSAIDFGVQPFDLLGTDPDDGATGVSLTSKVLLQFNAVVDAASVGAVTISDDTGELAVTAMLDSRDPTIVTAVVDAGLDPLTTYTVHVLSGDNGLKDRFGGVLAEDIELSFTTRDAPPPMVDAGVPDAGPDFDAATPDAAP